ncbi:hypothetical protein A2422_00085 [Candidatus Woesebacteria bacterium RIFOXYC1_FULL_31_51]|uniref:Uncharacterized protein n=1 Tax=Candidatus Woesebacteria bacterium GW2011_GWC2_31_9 TaxID=1618586 RepID=A0A0F9YXM7_9BACT|nr:MAG: hypothetical protein UR17_C0001G0470 [Candidatus Woesebacteria bacterium GW2011_GWF1_31_35]KKP31211.1 MAG: hypothetical protein UR21_C0013G0005 [Candidatus Woesebacteria bacterium GW2011_GWC2_31_9]OGM73267.1 MAG: hypothetical protein A2185_01620 [Candidatus Woesebacteria bacterium RIFOXYA1_FULL_31_71]OGM78219.1 MAG: hypothetical protein A2375_04225 [Candidatus Woesebacteria bacterium RIFOXYB1_FULL_31_120]OGM82224.1 MAG: hypothetical protein A2422_00085 [Candidatus Woesebacteria bacteriu
MTTSISNIIIENNLFFKINPSSLSRKDSVFEVTTKFNVLLLEDRLSPFLSDFVLTRKLFYFIIYEIILMEKIKIV